MNNNAPLALPLAVLGFGLGVLIAAPAKSAEADAKIGGIITGEVLCSLYRAGVSPEVGKSEALRITKKLASRGLLEPSDAAVYRQTLQSVFNSCPEVAFPDA